jgi:zinc-ribbon domain
MARFCGNCGTEVDETAVFCPTCGQPIDQASETEIPAAPAWPDPPQEAAPPRPEDRGPMERAPVDSVAPADWDAGVAPEPRVEDPTRVEAAPAPPRSAPAAAPVARNEARGEPTVNVPVTWPVMMSGWLIGGGAFVAALGTVIGLFGGLINPIDLLLVPLLLGITASVFFSGSVPNIPNLRLATLAVVLVAFGIGLDRIGFGGAGIGELLLFLGAAAAAIGAILLETGRDQPLGGPRA